MFSLLGIWVIDNIKGVPDLLLRALKKNLENQSVLLLHNLDSLLRGVGLDEYTEFVEVVSEWLELSDVLWELRDSLVMQSNWPVESGPCVDFMATLKVLALHQSALLPLGLGDSLLLNLPDLAGQLNFLSLSFHL